uniref:PABS domain-containing protein n=1 Tax=Alexandrium monilatum TaxID=311494 RepID=A0A7S4SI35_9DINO
MATRPLRRRRRQVLRFGGAAALAAAGAAAAASLASGGPALSLPPSAAVSCMPSPGRQAAGSLCAVRVPLRLLVLQPPPPQPWGGSKVRCLAGRAFFSGRGAAVQKLDPGRADINFEYLTPGRQLIDLPLDNGGSLQVTAHAASEQTPPPEAVPGSKQEWRVLRFTPPKGTTNLVQSVTKVSMAPRGPEPRVQLQREVLPLAYTKSFASIVLTTLAVLGAPVLPAATGEAKEPLRILCIGLGGGSVPSFFTGGLKHCEVDVVELEPAVLRAATEAMGFVRTPRLRALVDDGALFALRAVEAGGGSGPYHAVLVDAYDAAGNVPSELWSSNRLLAQALGKGLLYKQCGLVATNFLPHVDLAAPLSAYKSALALRGAGIGFSIQANIPVDEQDEILRLFEPEQDTGNRIAVQTCGGPPELATIEQLRERLLRAAAKVGEVTRSPFKMEDLVVRGLRSWESA